MSLLIFGGNFFPVYWKLLCMEWQIQISPWHSERKITNVILLVYLVQNVASPSYPVYQKAGLFPLWLSHAIDSLDGKISGNRTFHTQKVPSSNELTIQSCLFIFFKYSEWNIGTTHLEMIMQEKPQELDDQFSCSWRILSSLISAGQLVP